MRIFNKKEFLELPSGTLYTPMEDLSCGGDYLAVKGDTLINGLDFYTLCLTEWECGSSEALPILAQLMTHQGVIAPLNSFECREGRYENGDRYLVYEKYDLEKLKEHIERALTLVPGEERGGEIR